jgi:hypothetical protein
MRIRCPPHRNRRSITEPNKRSQILRHLTEPRRVVVEAAAQGSCGSINSFGTGSGLNRRIDRVVLMISNRSAVFAVASGIPCSVYVCHPAENRGQAAADLSEILTHSGDQHFRTYICPIAVYPSNLALARDSHYTIGAQSHCSRGNPGFYPISLYSRPIILSRGNTKHHLS